MLSTFVAEADYLEQTLSVGLAASGLWGIVSNVVTPYMLNPGAGNLQGKACWVTFGAGLLILAWSFFRVPETWGRNSEEVDLLFGECQRGLVFEAFLGSEGEAKVRQRNASLQDSSSTMSFLGTRSSEVEVGRPWSRSFPEQRRCFSGERRIDPLESQNACTLRDGIDELCARHLNVILLVTFDDHA